LRLWLGREGRPGLGLNRGAGLRRPWRARRGWPRRRPGQAQMGSGGLGRSGPGRAYGLGLDRVG
jgi:hypothetical protein